MRKRREARNDKACGHKPMRYVALMGSILLASILIVPLDISPQPISTGICAAPGPEWIDEKYEIRYITLMQMDILINFDIHCIPLLNYTSATADDLRILYATQPLLILEALNASAAAISTSVVNGTYSKVNSTSTGLTISVDNSTLEQSPGDDPYNPPIIVRGYIRLDFDSDAFGLGRVTSLNPLDVLMGILGMGGELRLPVSTVTAAGHNQTIMNYPPPGIIFGDGISYMIGQPLVWETKNWDGTIQQHWSGTMTMIAEKRQSYRSGRVPIDVLFEFENVTFLTTGETEFRVNVNVSARIFRLEVGSAVRKWYSSYIALGYINSDFIRLMAGSGLVSRSEVEGYLGMVNRTLEAGIRGTFKGVSNVSTHFQTIGLFDDVDVRNLTDAVPISIFLNTSFTYLYDPDTGTNEGSDRDIAGPKAVRIFTIQRTFVTELPGPMSAGYNFMGDGMLNYTFTTPENVIIYDVTADGKDIQAVKSRGRYSFTVPFDSSDGNKSLRVVFGAEVEYSIEPLIPYIMLVIALSVIWGALWGFGKKRDRALKRERQELLDRGELLEEDEQ